jgi:hypothetical protein
MAFIIMGFSITAFNTLTFSIMTFSISSLSIITYSMMYFKMTAFSITTHSMMTFSRASFSKKTCNVMSHNIGSLSIQHDTRCLVLLRLRTCLFLITLNVVFSACHSPKWRGASEAPLRPPHLQMLEKVQNV